MFISKKEYQEEVMVVLQKGIDFQESDLEGDSLTGGKLKCLPSDKLTAIAIDNGYDGWSWVGHYKPESGILTVKFRRALFVDEETKKIVFG